MCFTFDLMVDESYECDLLSPMGTFFFLSRGLNLLPSGLVQQEGLQGMPLVLHSLLCSKCHDGHKCIYPLVLSPVLFLLLWLPSVLTLHKCNTHLVRQLVVIVHYEAFQTSLSSGSANVPSQRAQKCIHNNMD